MGGEKKDRVTDALNATRAAVDDGIVPGGGSALLHASKQLEGLTLDNFDQDHGASIIMRAIRVPSKTIADNAGVEGAVVVGKLLEGDSPLGYNARDDRYEDMMAAGIIDPTKVVKTAFVDALGVASLMTTTETLIADSEGDDAAGGMGGMPPMGGGMGGMGGMG